jgi:hypothetical protein
MSDEINECEGNVYFYNDTYAAGHDFRKNLETSELLPACFYDQREPEKKKRIARWLDFIDR